MIRGEHAAPPRMSQFIFLVMKDGTTTMYEILVTCTLLKSNINVQGRMNIIRIYVRVFNIALNDVL